VGRAEEDVVLARERLDRAARDLRGGPEQAVPVEGGTCGRDGVAADGRARDDADEIGGVDVAGDAKRQAVRPVGELGTWRTPRRVEVARHDHAPFHLAQEAVALARLTAVAPAGLV